MSPIKDEDSARPISSLAVSLTVTTVSSPFISDQDDEIYTETNFLSIDQFWNSKISISFRLQEKNGFFLTIQQDDKIRIYNSNEHQDVWPDSKLEIFKFLTENLKNKNP